MANTKPDASQINYTAIPYLKTVSDVLNGAEVEIDRFLPTSEIAAIRARTSAYNCGPDLAAAIAAFTNGGGVFAKQGKYYFSSGFKMVDNFHLRGEGDTTEFWTDQDIELIYSDTTTINTAIFGARLSQLYLRKSLATATAKYDIHLQNPSNCKLTHVRVQSGHNDSSYSATNVGGVFLDKPAGSTNAAYINLLENCWLQNNSVYFKNITDSAIRGGFIWGHTRQFAVRLAGGGANSVELVQGIICSKFNGGIWLDGAGINQTRIIGNEFDGNPLLDTGTGVYMPDSSITTTISANTFWGCDKHGVDATDPVGLSVTGNNFWKNNAGDNFYDDIRITGKSFQPNGNTVTGNTHVIDEARTNKGYAIREVNAGFNPVSNNYAANGVQGAGYQAAPILILQAANTTGNSGQDSRVQAIKTVQGEYGLRINDTATVAAGGVLDIAIGAEEYIGTLAVSSTRTDYSPQSRKTSFAISAYGTTGVSASLLSQDGAGGGATFTVTFPSSGVVRITNTFANTCDMRISFHGHRAW